MENRTGKRLSIPLHALFVVCQYLGAAAVCLGCPGASARVGLWPGGPEVNRAALMLWPTLLLIVDILLDRAWLRALRADLAEGDKGLHRKTLEALAAPVLFLLDLVAMLTVLRAQNPESVDPTSVRLHTAAMAAGIVLWIYGRLLPRIPYNSIWGIRTAASLKGVQPWGVIHLKAMPGVCACGALCLAAGTFLSPISALACAGMCLIAAFAYMFTRK